MKNRTLDIECILKWNVKIDKVGFEMLKVKDKFGNCFFLLFSDFKNNFLFLKLKNLFGNPKWTENKNYS